MANTIQLASLSPRDAVTDALHRCTLGMDSNNKALFESACMKDESFIVKAGPLELKGWDAVDGFFARIWELVTTHMTSNIRVELKDGSDNASLTCHTIAYHNRPDDALKPEDTSYTAGCLYHIELVRDRDDDLWKISRWEIQILWTTGDRAVVHP